MRWKVLVVRPGETSVDRWVDVIRRLGVEPECAVAASRAAVLAALTSREWDVVIHDPASEIPVDLVYQHAPAAAIVTIAADDDLADELARVVATRADFD